MIVPNCFVVITRAPDTDSKVCNVLVLRLQRAGTTDAHSANDRSPLTIRWLNPASSVRWNLEFRRYTRQQDHEHLAFLAIQLGAQVVRFAGTRMDVQSSPEKFGSQQLRDMSNINPGVKSMRLAVATLLGWLKISATWMSFKLCSNFKRS